MWGCLFSFRSPQQSVLIKITPIYHIPVFAFRKTGGGRAQESVEWGHDPNGEGGGRRGQATQEIKRSENALDQRRTTSAHVCDDSPTKMDSEVKDGCVIIGLILRAYVEKIELREHKNNNKSRKKHIIPNSARVATESWLEHAIVFVTLTSDWLAMLFSSSVGVSKTQRTHYTCHFISTH